MNSEYIVIKKGELFQERKIGNYEVTIKTENKGLLEEMDNGINNLIFRICQRRENYSIEEYLNKKITEEEEHLRVMRKDINRNILKDNDFHDSLLKLKVLKDIEKQL